MMAAETLWVGGSPQQEVPAGWVAVLVSPFKSYRHCMDAKMWCHGEERPGEFGFTSAMYLARQQVVKGSVWAFSDPQVAFEFKMRFG